MARSVRLDMPLEHGTIQEETEMEWTTPEFVEVKMDAEINSYQDDFSGV